MGKSIKLNEAHIRKIVKESVKRLLKEEYGVDFEDTLAWVKKKKPNMSPEEQQKFAANIIFKKKRESQQTSAGQYKTFKEVEKAVRDLVNQKFPGDEERGVTHYKWALNALGFRADGYDQYGACAFTNGIVRVTVWYNREGYWCMEEASGRSETTDNFYNTSSEMHDVYGNYGRGGYTDPWNR